MRSKEIGRTILAGIPLQSDIMLKDLAKRMKPAPDRHADAGVQMRTRRRRVPTSELMAAVFLDDPGKVMDLMDEGGDPNFTDCDGGTPLMHACRTRRHRSAEALLERGADVNALSHDGHTPLMLAAMGGDLQTVKMLVGSGANINVQTPYGDTAKSIAWENRNLRIAYYLHRMEKALRQSNDPVAQSALPKGYFGAIPQESRNRESIRPYPL